MTEREEGERKASSSKRRKADQDAAPRNARGGNEPDAGRAKRAEGGRGEERQRSGRPSGGRDSGRGGEDERKRGPSAMRRAKNDDAEAPRRLSSPKRPTGSAASGKPGRARDSWDAPGAKDRPERGRPFSGSRPGEPKGDAGRAPSGPRQARPKNRFEDDRAPSGFRREERADQAKGRAKGGADRNASRFEGERRPGGGDKKDARPDPRRAAKATFERATEAYSSGQKDGGRKGPSSRQFEPYGPEERKRFPTRLVGFEEGADGPDPDVLALPSPVSATPPRPLLPEPESLGQAWALLERYAEALRRVHPLRPKHQRLLPYSIRRMSELLTSERDHLEPGYLSDGALLAAYLHYFLPWNLVRMTRLLASLPLELADGATIIDLGCGPLTFMQALWIARPELRAKKLSFVCVDRAPAAMRDGLKLFEELVRLTGVETGAWRAVMVHGGVTMPLRDRADLLVLANVLNELNWKGESLGRQAEDLAETFLERLTPGGKLLLIEPGVRRSGRVLAHLRTGLAEQGAHVIAPCLHQAACPMLERRQPTWKRKKPQKEKEGNASRPGQFHSWCHFNFSPEGAPRWLTELTKASELDKEGLSLSFLYAGRSGPRQAVGGKVAVRVVSESFKVLGRERPMIGSYGCSDRGLLLLLRELGQPPLRSGERFVVTWSRQTQRDPKSGAIELLLAAPAGTARGADKRGPGRKPAGEDGGVEPPRRPPLAPRSGAAAPEKATESDRRSGPGERPRPERPATPAGSDRATRPEHSERPERANGASRSTGRGAPGKPARPRARTGRTGRKRS